MNRIQISREDVEDPERLRERLDRAYAVQYGHQGVIEELTKHIAELQRRIDSAGVSAADRVLLKQLAGGGTSSAAPPQPGLVTNVETFADLPATSTAINGQMVRVRATNIKYVFDGPTRAWVAW